MSVAVITGGAGGMGLATARLLGADHTVVISDLKQEALDAAATELTAAGIVAETVVADIADRASVDALFARASSLGQVSAVVHAAGVSPQMGAADAIVRINALGTINVTEAALGVLGEEGALVNVASIAGHMLPAQPTELYQLALSDPEAFVTQLTGAATQVPAEQRSGAAYSLSKGFVIWYSAVMAERFGARGARILSVSPGSFDTAMGRLEESSGAAEIVKYAALKRFGRPEEVAQLLAFCVRPQVGYLTGTDILIDGGTKAGLAAATGH
ncbi:MAG: SDR family oxidoreductase [Nocardioides sp.]|nr:SDR family oxidoreductase [Nocardioides sp.]